MAVLLNNAAVGPDTKSWEMLDNWKKTFDVNLFGLVICLIYTRVVQLKVFRVINVQHTFVPVSIILYVP